MALIDSARVVAAGPGTLIPPLGASSPGLGAPIPEPAPFPAPHRFWFPRRHPEVVVRRRVRPTSALSRPIARGRGSTGRGLCVLHEGPTYLEYPRPSSSRSPPSCSGRWRHQITGSNGNQDRPTRRTSGLGCQGCPARRSGRGRPARWGTGLLSPTASNAPGWKDTHPAARNVPVVGRGASVTDLGVGCQREVRQDGDSGVRPHAPGRPRPRADVDRHHTAPSKGRGWCPRPGKPRAPVTRAKSSARAQRHGLLGAQPPLFPPPPGLGLPGCWLSPPPSSLPVETVRLTVEPART